MCLVHYRYRIWVTWQNGRPIWWRPRTHRGSDSSEHPWDGVQGNTGGIMECPVDTATSGIVQQTHSNTTEGAQAPRSDYVTTEGKYRFEDLVLRASNMRPFPHRMDISESGGRTRPSQEEATQWGNVGRTTSRSGHNDSGCTRMWIWGWLYLLPRARRTKARNIQPFETFLGQIKLCWEVGLLNSWLSFDTNQIVFPMPSQQCSMLSTAQVAHLCARYWPASRRTEQQGWET